MIDTVKYKIEVPERVLDCIKKRSIEYRGFDHNSGKMTYQVFRNQIRLGSHDYHINIFLSEWAFFVEFSMPKYLYGHNILLMPPEAVLGALERLRNELCKAFKTHEIPHPLFWQLVRLDVCYAWKFYDDATAQRVIEYMKNMQYARKKTANYGTSAMFVGKTASLKFYMKGTEFYAHDYKIIKQRSIDEANGLLDLARGVVRFEVTMRHQAIRDYFKVPKNSLNITSLLTRDNLITIMRHHMKNLLGVTTETMPTAHAFEAFKKYSPTRAMRLYSFYRLFLSSDPTDRSAVNSMPKSTRNRLKAILKKLRVGIPDDITDTRVDIGIPSEYSVGEFPVPRL